MVNQAKPKQRADGQKSGLSGEFFVAAELLKRDLQVSLTLGNAKSIDLFAVNDKGTRFTVQVKTALPHKRHYRPIYEANGVSASKVRLQRVR